MMPPLLLVMPPVISEFVNSAIPYPFAVELLVPVIVPELMILPMIVELVAR